MGSKLGPHINFVREADAMRDFLLTARPVAAKAINPDVGFWSEIKAEAPEIFLIGRRYVDRQRWDDPGGVARGVLNMSAVHVMDAWEGLNEPNRDNLVPACNLDAEVARWLHAEGIKYICGSWPVGVPDVDDWKREVMHEALREADYIGVHAYSAPRLDDWRGVEWWMLRHRLWYEDLPADCRKPLLITECGIDSGAAHWPVYAEGGWRNFTIPSDYVAQLAWFDGELQQDEYVKAALVYQWGSLDDTWKTYEWTPALTALIQEYIISQRDEPEPEPEDWQARALAAEAEVERLRGLVERMGVAGRGAHDFAREVMELAEQGGQHVGITRGSGDPRWHGV